MRPFDKIVEQHGAVVLRVCRALLDPVDADDAWSETFLAALRAYPRLRPDSNIEGWLVTIAHRKAIDVLRRQTRTTPSPAETLVTAAIDGVAHGATSGSTPGSTDRSADQFDQALEGPELVAALRSLPPKQQAAVVHHYLADLPYREVGEVMGISPEAARRNAADGIAALRSTYRVRSTPDRTAPPPRP